MQRGCQKHLIPNKNCLACGVRGFRADMRRQSEEQMQVLVQSQQEILAAQQRAQQEAAQAAEAKHRLAVNQAAQQNAFQWNQYLQTAHGQAFLAWSWLAEQTRQAIEARNILWVSSWTMSVRQVLTPPPPLAMENLLQQIASTKDGSRRAKRMVIVAGVLFLLAMVVDSSPLPPLVSGPVQALISLAFLGALITAAVFAFRGARGPARAGSGDAGTWLRGEQERLRGMFGQAAPLLSFSDEIDSHGTLLDQVDVTPPCSWTVEPVEGLYATWSEFSASAPSTYPSPSQFPPVDVPTPIPNDDRYPPLVQRLLTEWGSPSVS